MRSTWDHINLPLTQGRLAIQGVWKTIDWVENGKIIIFLPVSIKLNIGLRAGRPNIEGQMVLWVSSMDELNWYRQIIVDIRWINS